MKISDIGQRPANMPFTKAMALSILKAEFNSFNEGLLGINNDTRRFILHHFPELKDSKDFEISSGLVEDEEDEIIKNYTDSEPQPIPMITVRNGLPPMGMKKINAASSKMSESCRGLLDDIECAAPAYMKSSIAITKDAADALGVEEVEATDETIVRVIL